VVDANVCVLLHLLEVQRLSEHGVERVW
jgi:hypothetical protein